MNKRNEAVDLLLHYFALGSPNSRLSADGAAEVESIVDLIIDAAVEKMATRIRDPRLELCAKNEDDRPAAVLGMFVGSVRLARSSIPVRLAAALLKRNLRYTIPAIIYHMVSAGPELVGVFGDDGAYEWFIWDDETKRVRTSDVGYGNACIALCSGLVEAGVSVANGDHDLYLAWERRSAIEGE